MSENIIKRIVPFLRRRDLRWGNEAKLELRITSAGFKASPVVLRAITQGALISEKFNSNADGAIAQRTIGIDDIPIMLSINDEDNGFVQGQFWASVELILNGVEAIHLCSGFVYAGKGINFPDGTQVDQIPGHGLIEQRTSADPAAGVEASIASQPGELSLLHAIRVTLVTDATSTNRRVHFIMNGGNGARIDTFSDIEQGATLTKNYSVAKYGTLPDRADDNDILVPLPNDMWMTGEGEVATETVNLQAGDNFSTMKILVERYTGPG